ncbi:MAG: 1-phosphofructokinase, partial [Mycobacterium sp.]|nr:1-phosphofructokinase [Mycobacterium sp.]
MIITVTPNPSIDRTVTLDTPLIRGGVQRVSSVTTEPGGKGVNVARTLVLAGLDALAVLPSPAEDPLLVALDSVGVAYRAVWGATTPVRTNIAITEVDGTTTKLNEPGAPLDVTAVDRLTRAVLDAAATASWVVLSGSLPP